MTDASLRPHRGGTALAFCVMIALGGTACRSRSAQVEVEKHSPAVSQGRLVEDIGIETIGGHFTAVLKRGQPVPCQVKQTFSTAANNQDQIQIRMMRGVSGAATDGTPLGHFTLGDLPKLPKGEVHILVVFSVSGAGDITIEARESLGRPILVHPDDGR